MVSSIEYLQKLIQKQEMIKEMKDKGEYIKREFSTKRVKEIIYFLWRGGCKYWGERVCISCPFAEKDESCGCREHKSYSDGTEGHCIYYECVINVFCSKAEL